MRSSVAQAAVVGLILLNEALAGPVEINQVSGDARWLVHIDGDAIRASTVAQKAWQKVLKNHPNVESHLKIVRLIIGMDPVSDIRGVTIYGNCLGDPKAVTIVTASLDSPRLESLVSLIPGDETSKHGDYLVHRWIPRYFGESLAIAVAFRGHDQLVLATSVDDVKTALAVLDGKVSGLSADAALGGNIPAGTTFLARFDGNETGVVPGKQSTSNRVTAFRIAIGEDHGESFFRVRVTMTDPKAIGITLTVLHGVQAVGCLACDDDLWRKMIASLNSRCDGQTITILWSASASDVWDGLVRIEDEIIKRLAKQKDHTDNKSPDAEASAQKESPGRKLIPPEEDF